MGYGIMPRGIYQRKRDRKQQLGMWLGLPREFRVPRTQEELAVQLEVSKETLSTWKKDPFVRETQANAVKLYLGGQETAGLFMKSIRKGLLDGAHPWGRLYAEMMGYIGKAEKEKTEPIQFVIKSGTDERNKS